MTTIPRVVVDALRRMVPTQHRSYPPSSMFRAGPAPGGGETTDRTWARGMPGAPHPRCRRERGREAPGHGPTGRRTPARGGRAARWADGGAGTRPGTRLPEGAGSRSRRRPERTGPPAPCRARTGGPVRDGGRVGAGQGRRRARTGHRFGTSPGAGTAGEARRGGPPCASRCGSGVLRPRDGQAVRVREELGGRAARAGVRRPPAPGPREHSRALSTRLIRQRSCWSHRFFTRSVWWGGWDSNPRPTDYESAALTG